MNNKLKLNGAKKCNRCGQYIMFLKSKKGKWYPVDTAVLDGELVIMRGWKTGMQRFHNCSSKKNTNEIDNSTQQQYAKIETSAY